MLYEMITGTRLFVGESDIATLEKVRAERGSRAFRVQCLHSEPLERVVLKALAKERDDRYQTGAELHDELMRFLFADQNVYSAKQLAAFMKEAFAVEYNAEQERFNRWRGSATTPQPAVDEPQFEPTRLGRVGHTGSGLRNDDATRFGAPRGPFEPPPSDPKPAPPPVLAAPPPVLAAPPPVLAAPPPVQTTPPPRPAPPAKAKKKRLDDDGPVIGFFDDD